jgi:ankyrin repeat protein
MACRLANLEVISLLLASGADIEARDKVSRVFDLGCRLLSDCDETGYTPLHMASLLANLEVISLLLASEADIEARDKVSRVLDLGCRLLFDCPMRLDIRPSTWHVSWQILK